MINPNIKALKTSDNFKWDMQTGYQKSLQVFNFSGESNEEFKKNVKELIDVLKDIKDEIDILSEEASKLVV